LKWGAGRWEDERAADATLAAERGLKDADSAGGDHCCPLLHERAQGGEQQFARRGHDAAAEDDGLGRENRDDVRDADCEEVNHLVPDAARQFVAAPDGFRHSLRRDLFGAGDQLVDETRRALGQ
jgi:hypothetical protein